MVPCSIFISYVSIEAGGTVFQSLRWRVLFPLVCDNFIEVFWGRVDVGQAVGTEVL